METVCYTGAVAQKRLATTSISSRTGCCLYRLRHQCSDWGGKSVIMQRVQSKTICTNKRCDRDVGHQMATFCYSGVAVQKRLAVTSINSRTGCCPYRLAHQCSDWGGKSVIMQRVDSKTICTNKRCDPDVGHQVETFCYTGAVAQKRLAMTSIRSRTGSCLYRLPHQCSDWGGKSVIMQRVQSKTICTNKRCDRGWASDGNFLSHWRCGAEAVGSDLDQQQNWLLSVPSSPPMLGLGRQICHHAEGRLKNHLYQQKM